VSVDISPVDKMHPIVAITKAVILTFVIFSLKIIADIIITKYGAVYSKTAANDNVAFSTVAK
jgi:hypothetical protein